MFHRHHIIPLHTGGTDDSSNIELIPLEVHAERHKELWEKYGRIQDYGAWMMLSGRIGKEDLQKIWASMGGKAIKGIKRSDATRKKMGAWTRGEDFKNKFRGRKLSPEHIKAAAAGRARNWEVTNPQGETISIRNLSEFCRENGLRSVAMVHVARGDRNDHRGWKCKRG